MKQHRVRFRLALLIPVLLAAALYASFALAPSPSHVSIRDPAPPHYLVPEADWGHVRAFDGSFMFLLGPSTDQRRRYELGLGRVVFTAAAVAVADDEHGRGAQRLEGDIEGGGCLYHAQGAGVNVLVAIRGCVPGWAKDGVGGQAKEWIRVECLRSRPCVVVLEYR